MRIVMELARTVCPVPAAWVWFLCGGSRFFQVAIIQPYFRTRDPAPTPDLADSAKIRRSGRGFSIRAGILTLRVPLGPDRFRRAWVTPASGSHAPALAARSVRTVSKARSFPAIRESHPSGLRCPDSRCKLGSGRTAAVSVAELGCMGGGGKGAKSATPEPFLHSGQSLAPEKLRCCASDWNWGQHWLGAGHREKLAK